MTFVKNAWYVLGWDSEIDAKPFARTICGTPVVAWRKLDRSVVAMRDACPHRMLPLSMGIKEGDSIRCRYHGLKLGPDGVTEEMPIKTDPVNRGSVQKHLLSLSATVSSGYGSAIALWPIRR